MHPLLSKNLSALTALDGDPLSAGRSVGKAHARIELDHACPHTVDPQFKMEVAAKAVAGVAHVADELPLAHRLTLADHRRLTLVGVQGDIATAVVDGAVIAVG